jgi:hypothetical protein
MTPIQQQLRDRDCAEYLDDWDKGYAAFCKILRQYQPTVEFIVRHWDLFDTLCYKPYAADEIQPPIPEGAYYQHELYRLQSAMHFITFFVSHELNDDGNPSIVWIGKTRFEFEPGMSAIEHARESLRRPQVFLLGPADPAWRFGGPRLLRVDPRECTGLENVPAYPLGMCSDSGYPPTVLTSAISFLQEKQAAQDIHNAAAGRRWAARTTSQIQRDLCALLDAELELMSGEAP